MSKKTSALPKLKGPFLAAKAKAALANNPDMPPEIKARYQRVIDLAEAQALMGDALAKRNASDASSSSDTPTQPSGSTQGTSSPSATPSAIFPTPSGLNGEPTLH